MIKSFLTAISICMISTLFAQGIKGQILDENGDGLPHASIYVKEISSGTASNIDGYYALSLEPGKYTLTYQFIGYSTVTKSVTITDDFKVVNLKMVPQNVTLPSVNLSAKAEDPAYTIMRKAIAKAEFHLLQYNSYRAEVYMKGTGKLDKIPGLFRKQAAKEGIDTNRVFTSESVSEIYYERPNIFKEKVISVRVSGEDDANVNPNAFINSSFYLPMVVEGVSPLAPSAFSYYRFKYLGSFIDQGYEINEIEVIPRAKGENLYIGRIYIRENFYNIHSLELATKIQGFDLIITQNYAPVVNQIWMPVTQKFKFYGSLFGFAFRYNYLASVSNYNVEINPDLDASVVLIDEKIDPIPEDIVEVNKNNVDQSMEEVFKEDKKVTRKEFNKLIDEYEKEQKRKEKEGKKDEPDVVADYWYTMDTLAKSYDSTYWAQRRPVPLTAKEADSYKIDDSTYVEDKKIAEADSLRREKGDPFKFGHLFTGGYYRFGKRARFTWPGFLPEFRYNTVEGWNLDFTGDLYWRHDTTLRLRFTPNIRYGFDSEQWYGKLKTSFGFGKYPKRSHFNIEGGKYIYEFHEGAIDPLINSLYTILLVRNYMRLYDKDYVKVTYNQQVNYKLRFSIGAEWASRNELFNNSRWSLIDRENYSYTPNEPENIEVETGGFENSKALITRINVTYRPWLKFYRFNGKLRPIYNNSPEFRLNYNAGWNDVFGSITDFQQIELGFKSAFDIGIKATFDFDIVGGTFLNANHMEFMDFKHFDGGLTEFAPLSSTGNYRVLDYYLYSTQSSYLSYRSHINIRKFIFTQIPLLRMAGIRENLILNYLKTEYSPHYYEIGYGIDNILRILRLEFVQSFHDDQLGDFGIRIGISTSLN